MIVLLDDNPINPEPPSGMSIAAHVAAMETVRVALQRVIEREAMADPRSVAHAVLSGLDQHERDAVCVEFLAARAMEGA